MADKFDIEVRHPEYEEFAHSWEVMHDTFEGEDEVKEKGEAYLPMKSGIKALTDIQLRDQLYNNYKARAEFPELVAPTVRGCVGLIHDKETVIELPASMEYLREKATKDGLSLDGLHQKITTNLMKSGRFGLLPGVSKAGRFHIATYSALSIINWDEAEEEEGQQRENSTSYLVLDESGEVRNPATNKWEEQTKYLECFIGETGAFTTRTWTKKKDIGPAEDKWDIGEETIATRSGNGGALDFIPFVFIDTNDLTACPDDVPLYGLARLALQVYRLDADYKTTLHMTSEPTPWCSGVSADDAPKAIGSASLWVFSNENAQAGYLEFSGAGATAQENAIQNTLKRAVIFGAQVLQNEQPANESGYAKALRMNHQVSTIKGIAKTSAAGLERALRYIAIWGGADPEQVKVTPNMDFIDRTLGPQEITALVAAWQANAFSKQTLFENLQRGEIVDHERSFEDEEAMIEEEGPALGGSGNADQTTEGTQDAANEAP